MAKEKPKIRYSVQLTFASIFALFIAVMIVILSVYPTISSRDLVVSSKQSTLMGQVSVMSASLSALEQLSEGDVAQVMELVDAGTFRRVAVTDRSGGILYDTARYSAEELPELRDALEGKAAFSCHYDGEAFRSAAAAPVMCYGSIIGAVYVCDLDQEQAELIGSLQGRLRTASLVTGALVLVLIIFSSRALARRLTELVKGMRIVREGNYDYCVAPRGYDEVAELAEEFNDMTQRLKATEESRRRFVSDASHELRTPLASIRLLSDSIVQSEQMDEETMREFVADIGTEAERLQRTSEKLLKLTRMDSAAPVERSAVELRAVLNRTVHLLAPLAQKREVRICVEAEHDCVIWAAADDLYQIIFNLAENAIKYNSAGGSVFLTLRREEGYAILCVEDTGIGIPEEDIPYIFDRFYRVDKARSREAGGSGLGLSIVHDAVLANSGFIRVERRAEGGTRFVVSFPLYEEAARETEAAP